MLNLKSIAETLTAVGAAMLIAACGGSQTPTAATDASGQPEDSMPESSGPSKSSKDSSSQDTSVGDVRVSSAFDANGEPIPGADGDISPDAKRPPKPVATASASAEPAAPPPKKGAPKGK
jgi:hypothetical protein